MAIFDWKSTISIFVKNYDDITIFNATTSRYYDTVGVYSGAPKVKATDFNGTWNTRSVHCWNGKRAEEEKKDKRGEKFSSGLIDCAGSVGG